MESSSSFLLSYFPSNYTFSKMNLLLCLQDLHKTLSLNRDLVGFSLLVDTCSSIDDQFAIDQGVFKNTRKNSLDGIWFTTSSFKLVKNLISGVSDNDLILLSKSFYGETFSIKKLDDNLLNRELQHKFSSLKSNLNFFDTDLNISFIRNIQIWSNSQGFDQLLFFDLRGGGDSKISFIYYLVSLNNVFNPLIDLDLEENRIWGDYVALYQKIAINSKDFFALDEADLHFNKLILLWCESFSKRYKTLILINSSRSSELDHLWNIVSLLNNIHVFITGKRDYVMENTIAVPPLATLSDSLNSSLLDFLKSLKDSSLMILYITVVTKGVILTEDILSVLSKVGFNILELKEELAFYIRQGLLVGNRNLYSTCSNVLLTIREIKGSLVDNWLTTFLGAMFDCYKNNIFSYSYIYSIISLNSSFHEKGLKSLFFFIEKEIDLGHKLILSPELLSIAESDQSLVKILEYKKLREERVIDRRINYPLVNNSNIDNLYVRALNYLEVLNLWSENKDEKLINKSKEIFLFYQAEDDSFYESRSKILFSLALLSAGRTEEASDYLELNSNYCKRIKDTYTYIRSSCFLMVSLFIKGNISGVLRVSGHLLKDDWIGFKSKWFIYAMFIRARAFAELGDYSSGIELINKSIVIAKNSSFIDILKVLYAWKGRFLFYGGEEGQAREMLLGNVVNSEGFYFLAEIEFFSKNYEKALSYITQARFTEDNTTLFDENLLWRDGYFLIEEFYNRSGRHSVLYKEIEIFYLFLLTFNNVEGAESKLLSIGDEIPNDSYGTHDYRYLFYLYSVIDKSNNVVQLDIDNLLNKVIRLLHQRASNMDEHNQKHLFLSNFWNSKIFDEAKDRKLF
ncbi:MAG: hypothetical protein B6229_01250 [Spirochaetaceae bacterium 4572_7]|nr:MAG: hypothetical protein B6229_01250 [Spirochaetaceae bacterium 4572_7]